MMRRRDFLASSAWLCACGSGEKIFAGITPAQEFSILCDRLYHEDLQRSPETLTILNLDNGILASARSKLSDANQLALNDERVISLRKVKTLEAVQRSTLLPPQRVVLDTLLSNQRARLRVRAFDYVSLDSFSPTPYVISQVSGAYLNVPRFLVSKHKIDTNDDAEAYISRLEFFSQSLDANTERFEAAQRDGVAVPDFLLDTTIPQIATLCVPSATSELVTYLERNVRAKGLSESHGRHAADVYSARIVPALTRQIDALKASRLTAEPTPGVWRFKDGKAFYQAVLEYATTTKDTPDEIHRFGLDRVRDIGARLDVLLRKQGLSKGTVGERIATLYRDPAQFYSNDVVGRARLLSGLRSKLDAIRLRLPLMFDTLPDRAIEVVAVPAAIDAGAPLAFSEMPTADVSQPGRVYFNLHDTNEWPRFNLSSTLYHEGLPGHQLQGAIAINNTTIPQIARSLYFAAYSEGWAVYAEQLADELGMYSDDPLGRIGWLKAQIFRAGRCVIDTGIHHMRWSRARAVRYLIDIDGDAVGSTTREVDKHIAVPGQACSYAIGLMKWNELRDRARTQLGPCFDIKAFHTVGLGSGALPLDVLDTVVRDWIHAVGTSS